jgi:hypothetical protein
MGREARGTRVAPVPFAPTDAVDAAMRRVATGHGTHQAVLRALVGATVHVAPDARGALATHRDDEGRYTEVFTHPRHAVSGEVHLVPVGFADLTASLPWDLDVVVNPSDASSLRLAGTGVLSLPA